MCCGLFDDANDALFDKTQPLSKSMKPSLYLPHENDEKGIVHKWVCSAVEGEKSAVKLCPGQWGLLKLCEWLDDLSILFCSFDKNQRAQTIYQIRNSWKSQWDSKVSKELVKSESSTFLIHALVDNDEIKHVLLHVMTFCMEGLPLSLVGKVWSCDISKFHNTHSDVRHAETYQKKARKELNFRAKKCTSKHVFSFFVQRKILITKNSKTQ